MHLARLELYAAQTKARRRRHALRWRAINCESLELNPWARSSRFALRFVREVVVSKGLLLGRVPRIRRHLSDPFFIPPARELLPVSFVVVCPFPSDFSSLFPLAWAALSLQWLPLQNVLAGIVIVRTTTASESPAKVNGLSVAVLRRKAWICS